MRTGENCPIPVIQVALDVREAVEILRRFEAKLGDMRPGLSKVAVRACQMQLDHVDGGVDENYSPWPPLAPITIALKGSSKPLVDKGHMRAAYRVLRTPAQPNPPTMNSVEIEIPASERKKAKLHNKGGTITVKSKRVLARELTKAQYNKVLKRTQESKTPLRVRSPIGTNKNFVIFGKSIRIPKRQFFFINQREAAELTGILADHIVYGGLPGGAFRTL